MFKSYKFHKLAMSGLLTKPVCICEHANQCHTQPRIQGLISAPRPTPPVTQCLMQNNDPKLNYYKIYVQKMFT